jgi:hypothetical protein
MNWTQWTKKTNSPRFVDQVSTHLNQRISIARDVRTCSVVRRRWRTGELLVVGKGVARPVVLTGSRTARERPNDPPLIPPLVAKRALRPIHSHQACQGFCKHKSMLFTLHDLHH